MKMLAPKSQWIDDWFPEWNPSYMIRPLHGDAVLSQIRIDVSETVEAYDVKAEIPGVHKDDIDLQIKDSTVTISAEVKQEDRETQGDRVLRSERYIGQVSRSFELPCAIDSDACSAKYSDGILTILLPKTESKIDCAKIDIS